MLVLVCTRQWVSTLSHGSHVMGAYRGPLPFREIDADERVVRKRRRRGLVVAVKASGQNGQVGMGGGGRAEGIV